MCGLRDSNNYDEFEESSASFTQYSYSVHLNASECLYTTDGNKITGNVHNPKTDKTVRTDWMCIHMTTDNILLPVRTERKIRRLSCRNVCVLFAVYIHVYEHSLSVLCKHECGVEFISCTYALFFVCAFVWNVYIMCWCSEFTWKTYHLSSSEHPNEFIHSVSTNSTFRHTCRLIRIQMWDEYQLCMVEIYFNDGYLSDLCCMNANRNDSKSTWSDNFYF